MWTCYWGCIGIVGGLWRECSPIPSIQKRHGQECFAARLGDGPHVVKIGEDCQVQCQVGRLFLWNIEAHSSRRRSINSGLNLSPVMYSVRITCHSRQLFLWSPNKPNRCLSGSAGITQAGKSLTRCSRRNIKSWKRRRDDGFGVENIGRLV